MREPIDDIFDLDSDVVRRKLAQSVMAMRGLWRVSAKPKRETRSTRANSFYWAAVLTPFYQFLKEQEPTITDREQAHIELKRQVLGTRPIRAGNAVVRIIPTTHDMDVAQFMDYVDRARHWLREQVGIETLDPGEYGIERVDMRTGEVMKR